MKDFLHRDDLEEFISEQADKHRMYPSDKLWKNVRKQVHKPKKWPALSFVTMFVVSSLVILTVLNKPQPDVLNADINYTFHKTPDQKAIAAINGVATASQNSQAAVANTNKLIEDHLFINQTTDRTIAVAQENIKINNAVAGQLNMASYATADVAPEMKAPVTIASLSLVTPEKKTASQPSLMQTAVAQQTKSQIQKVPFTLTEKNFASYYFDLQSRLSNILNVPVDKEAGGVAFFSLPRFNSSINSMYDFDFLATQLDLKNTPFQKLSNSSSKFDFRFYLTPSVSYRRLTKSNKGTDVAGSTPGGIFLPVESKYQIKPSQAADHHPALGYETGFGLGYQLTKRLKLTGGFQFNISQYKIDAYLYKEEPAALTLKQGNFTSTINTTSSLRSTSGNKPITLRNRYYQMSIPLGIDYNLVNSKRLTWGLATSIQPTYTFDKQPLIFSSNYKNYADGSVYVRNFNINAAAETYIGYKTGSYTWQLGPQVRYQVLPSLENRYPNKEYLINYGLKVGVVKSLK